MLRSHPGNFENVRKERKRESWKEKESLRRSKIGSILDIQFKGKQTDIT